MAKSHLSRWANQALDELTAKKKLVRIDDVDMKCESCGGSKFKRTSTPSVDIEGEKDWGWQCSNKQCGAIYMSKYRLLPHKEKPRSRRARRVTKKSQFSCDLSFELPSKFEDDYELYKKIKREIKNALSDEIEIILPKGEDKIESVVVKIKVGDIGYDL